MLQIRSQIEVADNTGVKMVRCFGVIGRSYQKFAYVGDIITGSVRNAVPGCDFKIGDKVMAVVIRTKAPIRRADGSYVRFDENACVILNKDLSPKGTRIFGPVPRELRKFMKVISLAPGVV